MNELSVEDRRAFLMKAGSLLGISVCASSMAAILAACEKDESKIIAAHGTFTVNISNESALATVGSGIKKDVGTFNASKPVIIIRTSASAFAVFSSVCNHAGCEVSAPKTLGARILCDVNDNKCGHNAEFDTQSGVQVVGPSGGSPSGGLALISSSYDASSQLLTLQF